MGRQAISTLQFHREKVGLSQSAMAGLLNVNRSTISMVESGLRRLPSKAYIKLNEMVLAEHQKEQHLVLPELPAWKQEEIIKMINTNIRDMKKEVRSLNRRIEKMTSQYNEILKKVNQMKEQMIESNDAKDLSGKFAEWQYSKGLLRLWRHLPIYQRMLVIKRDGLQIQIDALQIEYDTING